MSKIKISYRPLVSSKRKARKERDGYCKFCGSLLKSDKSKSRGYGHVCAKKVSAIIVLDIRKEE